MQYLSIVLALPLFAMATNLNPPACRFTLENPGVWQGERVEIKSDETEDVYFLGRGNGGAIVYRHVPRDGSPTFVEKVYRSLAEANHDHHNLLFLENALAKGLNAGKHIRVVKVLKAEGRILWLEDIRGTDVERLYNETPDRRSYYWEKLWVGLNIIAGAMMDFSRRPEQFDRWQFEPYGSVPVPDDMGKWVEEPRPGKPERRLPEFNVHYEERHPQSKRWVRRSILVHGPNIIMEPDGMMVLIDPG